MSDGGDFEKRFAELTSKAIPEVLRRGLAQAGMQLMDDAISQVPKVPHDEGTLRGSGSVFVGRDLIGTSEREGGGSPTPARTHDQVSLAADIIIATVGFNTPYAARLHEHPEFDFTEEGTGGKYLEHPMNANRREYMEIVADEVAGAGR